MATGFTSKIIREASPYFYERIPYTQGVSSLAAGSNASLFSVSQWNTASSPSVRVALRTLSMTRWPALQLRTVYDTRTDRIDSRGFPGHGQALALDYGAVTQLNSQLVNIGTQTIPQIGLTYQVSVLRMSVATKVLYGYALDKAEHSMAQAMHLGTDPVRQLGNLPMPIETILEREFAARQIAGPIAFSAGVSVTPSSSPVAHVRPQSPNEIVVLRSIAVEAAPEDGVTLTINRDDNAAHVVVDAGATALSDPLDCFIPATNHVTVNIQGTTTVAYPVPVRLVIWRVSLSDILRVHLGIVTERELETLMGAEGGTAFWNQVQTGVY